MRGMSNDFEQAYLYSGVFAKRLKYAQRDGHHVDHGKRLQMLPVLLLDQAKPDPAPKCNPVSAQVM